MSTLIAIWAGGIGLPFVLVSAILNAQWGLAGGLVALFIAPHVLPPFPKVPFVRDVVFFGFRQWCGEVRFVDWSGEVDSMSEPEPEPAPGAVAGSSGAGGRKQLFLGHPHGIFSLGVMLMAQHRPDVKILSSSFLYNYAPIFRWWCEGVMGYKMGSVDKKDLTKLMKKGETPLMMVPGGFYEATISCPGHERVYLKTKMGFVKFALRNGYDLVPVYTIGESDLMANPQGGWGWRFKLNDFNIPAVLPIGWPLMPLFPRRGKDLVTVVGPPVSMPHIKNPTNEELKEHHARYVAAVKKLYERAVPGTASEKRKLEIW